MKYIKFKKILFSIIISINIIFFFSCKSNERSVKKAMISKKEVMEIANKEVARLKYNIEEMKIETDEENSHWKWYISKTKLIEKNQELETKLKNRNFWAIYYEPKKNQLGGDLFIFIDKNTGEVIGLLMGQ